MDNELCATENECFFNGLAQTRGEDTYFDDVNLVENNRSFIEISSSRMYLQMSKYTGSYDEVETWDNLQALAEEKYNFTKNDLFFFSGPCTFFFNRRCLCLAFASLCSPFRSAFSLCSQRFRSAFSLCSPDFALRKSHCLPPFSLSPRAER